MHTLFQILIFPTFAHKTTVYNLQKNLSYLLINSQENNNKTGVNGNNGI